MAVITVELSSGEALRVFGPARVRVVSGTIILLGAELGPGEEAEIGPKRSYMVKSLENGLLEVELEGRGRVEIPENGEEPLDEWVSMVDGIVESCPGGCVIAVMGPTDSGKTSLAALIANRSLKGGLKPAIVDADVGQADIGPPAFVSLGMPSSWLLWLRTLEPISMRFVGSIEPGPVIGRIITSTRELVDAALRYGASNVIVDTDGWVSGWTALEYKADLARAIGAHYVLVVGDYELYRHLERIVDAETVYLRSPRVLAARSSEDRRELRRENYRRFLEGDVRAIDLGGVKVQGSCVGLPPYGDEQLKSSIESHLDAKVLHIARYPGGFCIVVDSEGQGVEGHVLRALQKKVGSEVIIINRSTMTRVLSSLTDPEGNEHPALLIDIDFDSMTGYFKTKYDGKVKRVVFGRIRLDEEYGEEARGRIWV